MTNQWYKTAVFYELHVRAFFDSTNDGIGDFNGLTQKLDYLKELGVDCLWLMPFYPSPLRDDGYDIADYYNLHPDYGTLDDFKRFLDAAHQCGLRVITDLVMNHTSDQHAWFQAARQYPNSPYRDYYVWSDTPEKYKDARIIFIDTERSNWTWDDAAGMYYWHRFFSHQPDLNYDNPAVQEEMFKVLEFWLDMGLDGFRADAVPYLFEREGTNCENLPETHEFLKNLRRRIDDKDPDKILLAEANQWPDDVRAYFGDGDEFHMAFNFPVMPRLYMGLRREDRTPIIEIIEQLPAIPENCQWCTFLRNHDELTLEMVTDEERDYMYHEYAKDPRMKLNLGIRRRLAPLLDTSRRRMELLNAILVSLPGSPIIYYGDEIAMGDNIYLGDRNGVRTPMQWSIDRNAGFSRADAAQLYAPVIADPVYGYMGVNVEAEERSPSSLLNWMKLLIKTQKTYEVFGRGSITFLKPQNYRVLAYIRSWEDQQILCINNLSRFSQYAELDMHEYNGRVPVDVFGNTHFPRIGELPYLVTMGPHAFYWFRLV
jgi:maltose alpha-D-glucosyltransferase/alpha-amylase